MWRRIVPLSALWSSCASYYKHFWRECKNFLINLIISNFTESIWSFSRGGNFFKGLEFQTVSTFLISEVLSKNICSPYSQIIIKFFCLPEATFSFPLCKVDYLLHFGYLNYIFPPLRLYLISDSFCSLWQTFLLYFK